jgi:hypothetical protein
LQAELKHLQESLQLLAASPDASYQTAVSEALNTLGRSMANFDSEVTPAQVKLIEELHGRQFFSMDLVDAIRDDITRNAMFPAVVSKNVDEVAEDRERYLAQLTAVLKALTLFGLKGEAPAPGTAELAFLIPRRLFDNHLEELSDELSTIDRIIRPFRRSPPVQLNPWKFIKYRLRTQHLFSD